MRTFTRRQFLIGGVVGLVGAMGGSLLFGMDNQELQTTHIKIPIKGLHPLMDGYKIVHISDLHVRWLYVNANRVTNVIKEVKPDVIAYTGDYINRARDIPIAIQYMKQIRTMAPVVSVFGNNDHDNVPDEMTTQFAQDLNRIGVTHLTNEALRLERGNGSIWLVGLDDPLTHHADADAAFAQVDDSAPTVVLAHSTNAIELIAPYQPKLLLSGHTHGGQVRWPIIGPVFGVDEWSKKGYFEGHRKIDGIHVYINRGLGCNVMPVRLNCPPEITVITLTPDASNV